MSAIKLYIEYKPYKAHSPSRGTFDVMAFVRPTREHAWWAYRVKQKYVHLAV